MVLFRLIPTPIRFSHSFVCNNPPTVRIRFILEIERSDVTVKRLVHQRLGDALTFLKQCEKKTRYYIKNILIVEIAKGLGVIS